MLDRHRVPAACSAALAAFTLSLAARAQYIGPEPPPEVEPWYEAIELRAFADAYAAVNYEFPKPQDGKNQLRAFDRTNGFALSWVGLDASYEPEPVGATVSLRFGPTAEVFARDDAAFGLTPVKQAFASWKPRFGNSPLRLDFGKFDSIYGAEAAESQDNINYTRGALFTLIQPWFHTGLRATWQLSEALALRALAVNGWNNSVDNNAGKSFGAQVEYTPTRRFRLKLGWLGGPEQDDTTVVSCAAAERYSAATGTCVPDPSVAAPSDFTVDRGGANELDAWRHLVDLTADFQTERLYLGLNAAYVTEGQRAADHLRDEVTRRSYYAGMLGARFALTEAWAVAGRAEYLRDPDGAVLGAGDDGGLVTGTLTIEAKPTDQLILRLDNRADLMLSGDDEDVFAEDLRSRTDRQLTTTLGVVITTP